MEYIVVKTIPRNQLKEHKDYVGFLFKNQDGVYNICDTVEDVVKSNRWFNNLPVYSILVSNDPIEVGDKILVTCTNKEMNGKTFTYKGDANEGVGLVSIVGRDGNEILTTKLVLDGAYKVIRATNRKDKEKMVNGVITSIVK